MNNEAEILALLRSLDARLERMENALGLVAGLATRRKSRKAQAKAAGCSVTTLWRRERKMRAELLARGIT